MAAAVDTVPIAFPSVLESRTTVPFELLSVLVDLIEDEGSLCREIGYFPLAGRSVLVVGTTFSFRTDPSTKTSSIAAPTLFELASIMSRGVSRLDLLESHCEALSLLTLNEMACFDYKAIAGTFAKTNQMRACSLQGFLDWFVEMAEQAPSLSKMLAEVGSRSFLWKTHLSEPMPEELAARRYNVVIVASETLNGTPKERRLSVLVRLFGLLSREGVLYVPSDLVDLSVWKKHPHELILPITRPVKEDGDLTPEMRIVCEGRVGYVGGNPSYIKIWRTG